MTKKIKCQQTETKTELLRVKIIKAPLVDSKILKCIITDRARAIVL